MPVPSPVRAILSVAVLLAVQTVSSQAEFLYDNSDTGGTDAFYSLVEYGDEIILAGTSRVMSQFVFEYYGDFVPAGDETARLRLYKNDGPATKNGDPSPGTLLFDSGSFSLSPGYQTKTFGGLNVSVPGDMTWTVEFSGLGQAAGDRAGLVFRDKPSVGSSYDDFWQKSGGTWQLFNWGGTPIANFAARVVSGGEATHVAIRRVANKVVIEWTGLSILQVADSAKGNYVDIANARNRYETSPGTAAMRFWRLRD